MCYFNGRRVSHAEYIKLTSYKKQIDHLKMQDKLYNDGFEFQTMPVIIPTADKLDIDIVEMEWGFIPWWVKNREEVNKMRGSYKNPDGSWHEGRHYLNAKGEELLNSKVWRDAALKRRCLVYSTHYYEWRHLPQIGKKGQPLKTTKAYPYLVSVKDEPYFFIAGIYNRWVDKDSGETVDTCALVTTKANSLTEQVHNKKKRMPAILPEELAAEWIMKGLDESRITELANYQLPADKMYAYTIAKDFKQLADPTEPVDYPEVPQLTMEAA